MEPRDTHCPNGDPHAHMNFDILNPIYICTYCTQIITRLWIRFWEDR